MKLSFSYQITLPKKPNNNPNWWTKMNNKKINKLTTINFKKKRRPFYHNPFWESERIF